MNIYCFNMLTSKSVIKFQITDCVKQVLEKYRKKSFNKMEDITMASSRNQQVEGLRGVAIMIIVLYHVVFRFQQIYLGEMTWTNPMGRFGTCLFMIISCYYLVDFKKSNSDFSLSRYLKKKFWRLWPCYAIAITITAVVIHIWPLPERMSTLTDWILNIIFVNGFIDTPYIDGAHWYLTTLISFIVISGIAKKIKLDKTPFFYLGWMIVFVIAKAFDIEFVAILLGGGVLLSVYYYLFHKGNVPKMERIFQSKTPALVLRRRD